MSVKFPKYNNYYPLQIWFVSILIGSFILAIIDSDILGFALLYSALFSLPALVLMYLVFLALTSKAMAQLPLRIVMIMGSMITSIISAVIVYGKYPNPSKFFEFILEIEPLFLPYQIILVLSASFFPVFHKKSPTNT